MAELTIAAPGVKSKEAVRERLSALEIALLAEMFEKRMTTDEIAARFA
jgi:hypothetical protein